MNTTELKQTITDYLEVLKDITKNCDMDTQTAVEKLFRQYHVAQKEALLHQFEGIIDMPQTQWGNAVHQVKADIDHFRAEQRKLLTEMREG